MIPLVVGIKTPVKWPYMQVPWWTQVPSLQGSTGDCHVVIISGVMRFIQGVGLLMG
jgi:hypothetical protein